MDEEPGDPGHEALERFLAEEIGHGVGSSDDGHGATVVVNELLGEVASFQAEDVLGGMGSLRGVVVGAVLLAVLPEKLRDFQEYRMLVFGMVLVAMMTLRPDGLFPPKRAVAAKRET